MTEYQKPKEVSATLGRFENGGIVAGVAAENQRLLAQKEASVMLGYSENSNILAKMRMSKNKGKWEFMLRFIIFNGEARYPPDCLNEDIKKLKRGVSSCDK